MNAIVCMSRDRSIGRDNKILYPFVSKLNLFEQATEGCIVVMGRHTFECMGPLKNRINIVLTSKIDTGVYSWTGKKFHLDPVGSILVYNDLEELLDLLQTIQERIWIIGGGKVYSLLLPYVNTVEIIEVQQYERDSDVKFPELSEIEWDIVTTSEVLYDDDVCYLYKTATRKQLD